MKTLSLTLWVLIYFLIWSGWIRSLTAQWVTVIVSFTPILFLLHGKSLHEFIIPNYLSPALLALSHLLFSQAYEYLYGMKPDPGRRYSNKGKFSNRKLNIGDHIVWFAPLIISALPAIIKS